MGTSSATTTRTTTSRTTTRTTTTWTTTTRTTSRTSTTTSRTTTITTSTTQTHTSTTTRTTTTPFVNCQIEVDVDFWKDNLLSINGVTRAELCRSECHRNDKCGAWTWGKARDVLGLTDVCFLKKLDNAVVLRRHTKHGVVSGERCKVGWRDPLPATSLYCWALMQPHGYERGLLTMEFKRRASIFSCDEYKVYSDQVIILAKTLQTGVVHHNLTATYGGKYYTAMNTFIFAAAWRKVIYDGRYRSHSWTVKVDPDTVFLPERLRERLRHIPDSGNGVYINN